MRKLLIGVILEIITRSVSLAQTNFYTNVTNLWWKGDKSNVLNIANARLAINSNDIAGLILKANYDLEFLEVSSISNAYLRVLEVGDTITTTNFIKCWQTNLSRQCIIRLLDVISENPLSAQEIQEGKIKALIPNKLLPDADLIEALQKDGYFD